jgi:tetratricopeptide (TPR) repeat protein
VAPASGPVPVPATEGGDSSPEEAQTHYDLGVAYREMGLHDQAIQRFQLASRAPGREVDCHTMIGQCYVAKGMFTEAISHFKKALYVEGLAEREVHNLYIEMGEAYERLEDPREALYYYEKVAKRDPAFRDAAARVRALGGRLGGPTEGQPGAAAGG